MSIFGFEDTPPKKPDTGKESEGSSTDWSPKSDFCDSPNSITINWDFPKPRLSRKTKQDVKALAATMKSAHIKKQRLKQKAFRNSVESKTKGFDKQTSPLSHLRHQSYANKKRFIPRSRFDYEELEKIDLGSYVNISLPFSQTDNKNNSSSIIASNSSEPSMSIKEKPEADNISENSSIDKNTILNKELPKHLIEQFLDDDINLFLTSELDSW